MDGEVREIQVKQKNAASHWIWGAFKMPGAVLHDLHSLWLRRGRQDEYLGTLVNAYLDDGGKAYGVTAGENYVDVGTLNGYRTALSLLATRMASARGVPAGSDRHAAEARIPVVPIPKGLLP